MFHKYILTAIILFSYTFLNANDISIYRTFDSIFVAQNIEDINMEYGNNVSCPIKYRSQILIAFSYYPELKNVPIEVKFSEISTTASCRPKISSIIAPVWIVILILFVASWVYVKKKKSFVLYPKLRIAFLIITFSFISVYCYASYYNNTNNDREYTIRINNKADFEGILLKNVPLNAQIGILAHEIAHIVDYEKRNIWGVIDRAFDYLSDNSKKNFEYEIDSLTIEHGLGWQLYDWSDYALNKSNATEEYKAFKRKIYMSPNDIVNYMKNLEMYNEINE